MGNKYEVYSWKLLSDGTCYEYETIYTGRSFFLAMFNMFREKRRGVGCVKFYWR